MSDNIYITLTDEKLLLYVMENLERAERRYDFDSRCWRELQERLKQNKFDKYLLPKLLDYLLKHNSGFLNIKDVNEIRSLIYDPDQLMTLIINCLKSRNDSGYGFDQNIEYILTLCNQQLMKNDPDINKYRIEIINTLNTLKPYYLPGKPESDIRITKLINKIIIFLSQKESILSN